MGLPIDPAAEAIKIKHETTVSSPTERWKRPLAAIEFTNIEVNSANSSFEFEFSDMLPNTTISLDDNDYPRFKALAKDVSSHKGGPRGMTS